MSDLTLTLLDDLPGTLEVTYSDETSPSKDTVTVTASVSLLDAQSVEVSTGTVESYAASMHISVEVGVLTSRVRLTIEPHLDPALRPAPFTMDVDIDEAVYESTGGVVEITAGENLDLDNQLYTIRLTPYTADEQMGRPVVREVTIPGQIPDPSLPGHPATKYYVDYTVGHLRETPYQLDTGAIAPSAPVELE